MCLRVDYSLNFCFSMWGITTGRQPRHGVFHPLGLYSESWGVDYLGFAETGCYTDMLVQRFPKRKKLGYPFGMLYDGVLGTLTFFDATGETLGSGPAFTNLNRIKHTLYPCISIYADHNDSAVTATFKNVRVRCPTLQDLARKSILPRLKTRVAAYRLPLPSKLQKVVADGKTNLLEYQYGTHNSAKKWYTRYDFDE